MDVYRNYLRRSADRLTSFVLVLPLLILYNLGLSGSEWKSLNGADLVTMTLVRWTGREGFIVFQIILAVGFVAAIAVLRRRGQFQIRYFLPLLTESLVYAVTMGSLILLVMEEARLLGPSSTTMGLGAALTVSAGAGVHEELLFRQMMIPGLRRGLTDGAELSKSLGLALAVAVSSILFSLAHYIGPESFSLFSFTYRCLAGLFFATLFLFRGFAVAVYTHFLYDVYVLAWPG